MDETFGPADNRFNSIPACVVFFELPQGSIVFVSDEFCQLLGYDREQLKSVSFFQLASIEPEDFSLGATATQTTFRTNDGNVNAAMRYSVDIDRQIVHAVLQPEPIETGEHGNLQKEVIDIDCRERQRIRNELHDSLGQQLTGLGYLAQSLQKRLNAQRHSDAELAEMIASGIQDSIGETGRIVRGLSPVELDNYGLQAALKRLVRQVQDTFDIKCSFSDTKEQSVEDNNVATQLFHIAQESVNNAVKHAKATKIQVALYRDKDHLILEVIDNGIGFVQRGGHSGMGLKIMQYRSSMIGAILSIDSVEGKGTTIACRVVGKREPNV